MARATWHIVNPMLPTPETTIRAPAAHPGADALGASHAPLAPPAAHDGVGHHERARRSVCHTPPAGCGYAPLDSSAAPRTTRRFPPSPPGSASAATASSPPRLRLQRLCSEAVRMTTDPAEALPGPSGPVAVSEIRQVQLVVRGAKAHLCVACDSEIAPTAPSLVITATGPYRPWRLCEDCAPDSFDGAEVLWGRGATWRAPGLGGDSATLAGWRRLPISREEAANIEERRAEQRRIDQAESEERWRQHNAEQWPAAAAQKAAEQAAWEKAMAVLTEMCGLAGKYVGGGDQQWAIFEHIADGLAHQAADLLCPAAAEDWYGPPHATLGTGAVAFIAAHVCKLAALSVAQRLLPAEPEVAVGPPSPDSGGGNGA